MAYEDRITPEGGMTDRATRQLVAVYETRARAGSARDQLRNAGLDADQIDVLDAPETAGEAGAREQGIWSSIRNLFVPEADAHGYAEGIRRGHSMVIARPRTEQWDLAMQVLERTEPLDFDSRMADWRRDGWTGTYAGSDWDRLGTTAAPATGAMPPAAPGIEARPIEAAGMAARPVEGEQRIPVTQEELHIGKREVDRGSVRVRSYVVEEPVHKDLHLRDETVSVERRPVDRPVSELGGDAFRERTIEVTAKGEEPVVAKEARVKEEVVVRKDAAERTERVDDKLRRTEVEVEDNRNTAPVPKSTPRKP